ncbi:hypothetical protein SDC9_72517 [bioreactor metagenome]|uniref:Uncharacterized protein n=1 Tax=bioreactor metagenome TaxID=1076179 RepID=A0A644YBT4_9ZZZZ
MQRRVAADDYRIDGGQQLPCIQPAAQLLRRRPLALVAGIHKEIFYAGFATQGFGNGIQLNGNAFKLIGVGADVQDLMAAIHGAGRSSA